MKKKIISICITLFIFLSSTVGVFAVELVANTQVPYWLLDIYHQCWLSNNAADVTFGLATYGPTSRYLVDIARGGALYLTYEVPAGETVYFRWAIARNNMGNFGWSTYVRMSVDGSQKVNHEYNYSNLGEYGTYGSIVIVEDYTNTSNSKQLVTYVITNDGVASAGSTSYSYVPILVGTDVLIEQGSTEFSDFDYTVDLTGVEDKLDDIIELLQQRPTDISFEIPFEFWQHVSFFINCYDYQYQSSDDRIPWLHRTTVFNTGYNANQEMRYLYQYDYFFFSLLSYYRENNKPRLYGEDGSVIEAQTYSTNVRGNGYGCVYTYRFTIPDTNTRYSLWLPNTAQFKQFIPIYLGNGDNVTDLVASYTGLNTRTTSQLNTITSRIQQIISIFNENTSSSITNSQTANNNLSQSVTQFDNLEREQVNNFTQNITNLPSFDFGSISDFSTTANFVSTQMQNIYNSSDYIKFIYTAVLTFGIALVLIGRGLRR